MNNSVKTWFCLQCHLKIESAEKPSDRFEHVSSFPIGKNSFRGVTNTDYQRSAKHCGPVCFGNERGEDFRRHIWIDRTEVITDG